MRKLVLSLSFAVAVASVSAAPKKPSTPAQLAGALTEIGGLDADQKAKLVAVFETYIDGAKAAKKPSDWKKLDEQAWTDLNTILKPEQLRKVWAYVARENEKERKDKLEDIRDRVEDLKDKIEDRKDKADDKKKKLTPAEIRKDKAEDKKDKAEDKKDKAEDKKDRKDDAYDTKDEVRVWLNGLKARVGTMKLPADNSPPPIKK